MAPCIWSVLLVAARIRRTMHTCICMFDVVVVVVYIKTLEI
jgi:hypothetical protein